MRALYSGKISIGDVHPILQEGFATSTGGGGAVQHVIIQPLGAPVLANGTTYKGTLFVAPCNGCQVKEMWLSAGVKIASGTNTLAVSNYDKSASTAKNVLTTATVDPAAITALQGTQLPVVDTIATLEMDEGDILNYTLTVGTQGTAGQGYAIQAIVWVPDLI